MSTEPLGSVPASAAGSHVAQTVGTDVPRSQHAAAIHQARALARAKAQAGVPAPDGEDLKPDDRDADGRQPWEVSARERNQAAQDDAAPTSQDKNRHDDDPGARLDMVG